MQIYGNNLTNCLPFSCRVSYLEFLKPVAKKKATHRYGNHMNEVLNHPQSEIPLAPIVDEPHKGLSGISARLRQQVRDNIYYSQKMCKNYQHLSKR